MQISSASSYTPQSSGSLAADNQNQVAEQRDRFRVQQAQQSIEPTQQSTQKNAQQAQKQILQQSKQPEQVERFDVDEQALALVEQAQLDSQKTFSQSPDASQNVPSLPAQSNNEQNNPTSKQSNNQSSYDSPSQQNQTAVAAYSSVGQIAQRENIQQVFGVDLFA